MSKPAVLVAVVIFIAVGVMACVASVDEVERRSQSLERNARIVASYTWPTATPNPVEVTSIAASRLQIPIYATPTSTPDPDTVCNADFIGLDTRVDDAISRGYEINFTVAEDATSPEHFASLRLEAAREIARIWRDVGYDRGDSTKVMLAAVAEAWEINLTTDVDDGPAQLEILRAIADAYMDLSEEFEKCSLTSEFGADLEEEALELRQLASDLTQWSGRGN